MDLMFARYPEHDAAMSAWMADHGWPVTRRVYDDRREVFAWLHGSGVAARTLRVTQAAIEDTPPGHLRALLDTARVAAALTREPSASLVVGVDAATGTVGVRAFDAPLT